MSRGKRGLGAWLYARAPRLITAAGYVVGLAVLGAAAATTVFQTTIMLSGSGELQAAEHWLTLENPTLVLAVHAQPGARVDAGAPLVTVVDDPRYVRRARYLTMLRDGLTGLKEELGPDRPASEVAGMFGALLERLRAGLPEKTLTAPVAGWVAGAGAEDSARAAAERPAGDHLTGVANLDQAAAQLTASDARMPTVRVGDAVPLLLPEWSTQVLTARAAEVRVSAVCEVAAGRFDEARLAALRATPRARVALWGTSCPAEATVTRDSVTFRVAVDGVPPEMARRLRSGKSLSLVLEGEGGQTVDARLGTLETATRLELAATDIPESARRELQAALERGETRLPIGKAWVGLRRCSLFARLFGR